MNTNRIAAAALTSVFLVLGGHTASVQAQTAPPRLSEQLHANAVASFRQGRFPEAYGRFIALADAGHAPAAEMALWMYLHGPTVFGKEWDSSQEQLNAWAQLSRQPAPVMTPHVTTQALHPVADRRR